MGGFRTPAPCPDAQPVMAGIRKPSPSASFVRHERLPESGRSAAIRSSFWGPHWTAWLEPAGCQPSGACRGIPGVVGGAWPRHAGAGGSTAAHDARRRGRSGNGCWIWSRRGCSPDSPAGVRPARTTRKGCRPILLLQNAVITAYAILRVGEYTAHRENPGES
jgi:hypothetical protein